MDVIQDFVRTDRIHVGIYAVTWLDAIFRKSEPLPFRKAVDHLGAAVAHVADGEGHSPLDTVEIIVDPESLKDEKRCGYSPESQLGREVHLKEILNFLDGCLRLVAVKQRSIAAWYDESVHRLQIYMVAPTVDIFHLPELDSRDPVV